MSDASVMDMRVDYRRDELEESNAPADAIELFTRWFDDARNSTIREANAMTLATVDSDGRPSARIVLLKDYDRAGFTFYTNYDSRKGRAIAHESRVALLFFWDTLERQVRIEGLAHKVDREESAAYFATRPRASQLGAWASDQSDVIESRATLERAYARLDHEFPHDVPLPPHWGGYRVTPSVIEFWQGRSSRLHDRLRYERAGDAWRRERLSP